MKELFVFVFIVTNGVIMITDFVVRFVEFPKIKTTLLINSVMNVEITFLKGLNLVNIIALIIKLKYTLLTLLQLKNRNEIVRN